MTYTGEVHTRMHAGFGDITSRVGVSLYAIGSEEV